MTRLANFFDELRPYLKQTANIFINVGDTYFGSGAGAWSKYLDENGNITEYQKRQKEKYFTTKPLQPKIKQSKVIRFGLYDIENDIDYNERTVITYNNMSPLVYYGMLFNKFLRGCGFRRDNDYIFMEDITGEEYRYLSYALYNYRHRDKENE